MAPAPAKQKQHLSRTLSDWRRSQGLTQPGAAQRIGISKRSYQDYERAKALPGAPALHRLAEGTGIDSAALLGLPSQDGRGDESKVLAELERLRGEVARLRKDLAGK